MISQTNYTRSAGEQDWLADNNNKRRLPRKQETPVNCFCFFDFLRDPFPFSLQSNAEQDNPRKYQ